MRALAAAVLTLLVLAAWPPVAAVEAGGLEATLRPVSTSLEAGKAYLVGFSVKYPCGPSRTIRLEISHPEWTEAAVDPHFTTRSDRCLEPYTGEYGESILVDVFQDAAEGAAGNLTLIAYDGNVTASATVALTVRKVTPQAAVEAPDGPFAMDAEGSVTFDLTTRYTFWQQGRIRWVADAPEGWKVAVPATRATETGEDRSVVAPFVVGAPASANGTYELGVHAVLVDRAGVRVADSPVTVVLLDVTPLPVAPAAVAGASAPTPPEAPRTVPPRAPVWLVGSVLVVAVAGIYVLENRDARRRPPRT